ncbi:transposon Ty3-G Gag-Pol polyprotein [Trichonephila inaurata madagascariensis]|uniref:Transposon Ty3-G Gag-Pol polyprotein n=1 Tax=Trichonephila inaurata madagascariensis TaxID=2747483 RepID=A0A8X6YCK1_9ARAC|nr:transposon Ty3-G Gag-Pol polyprotein [Trichonephila inaurata madagascariensis]
MEILVKVQREEHMKEDSPSLSPTLKFSYIMSLDQQIKIFVPRKGYVKNVLDIESADRKANPEMIKSPETDLAELEEKRRTLAANRIPKLVLKGLPATTDADDIKNDLLEKGIKVEKVTQLRQFKTKMPQPIYMMEISRDENVDDILPGPQILTFFSTKIHVINDFSKLLNNFPNISKPSCANQEVKDIVVHSIDTFGPPVCDKPRHMAPDRLKNAKMEFQHMLDLGHLRSSSSNFSSEGISPLPDRVDAIQEFQLRRFLGMYNFYRRFIPKAAHTLAPLVKFLGHTNKKEPSRPSKNPQTLLEWTKEVENSLTAANTLKQH